MGAGNPVSALHQPFYSDEERLRISAFRIEVKQIVSCCFENNNAHGKEGPRLFRAELCLWSVTSAFVVEMKQDQIGPITMNGMR